MLAFYLSLLETDSDRLIFTQIYALHEQKMYAAAKSVLHSPEQAEDAVHDSFIKVIKHFETCKTIPEDELPKWLITIVKRTALDILKKDGRSVGFDDLSAPDLFVADDTSVDSAAFRELIDKIRALPENYREILELKFVLEWSDKEIAEALGLNGNTVRSRIMRGKELLRKEIERLDV